jgi:hypothetical protein
VCEKGSRVLESMRNSVLKLKPGEIVEVRSAAEITATLDKNNTLQGLSFSPEMLRYCGRKYKVLKPITKMIVEGWGRRQIKNTVLLDGVVCNGAAHEGCQRMCTLLWKEAWLKRVGTRETKAPERSDYGEATMLAHQGFLCQSALLHKASKQLPISFEECVRKYFCSDRFRRWWILNRACAFMLWSTLKVKRFFGFSKNGTWYGSCQSTPAESLHLRPGELVDVKNKEEIIKTLDMMGKNRGLAFTQEMQQYCGKRFRVLRRIDKIIDEETGQMHQACNTVMLKNAVCDGSSHDSCPRNCLLLWREIWLKRV